VQVGRSGRINGELHRKIAVVADRHRPLLAPLFCRRRRSVQVLPRVGRRRFAEHQGGQPGRHTGHRYRGAGIMTDQGIEIGFLSTALENARALHKALLEDLDLNEKASKVTGTM